MDKRIVIVTGCFGAPIEETARALAASENLRFISLDEEITKRDGRPIKRLVMMNGEHGYRNQEYELLTELCADPAGCVIACGDGVLYDEDSRAIALANELVLAGQDESADELWVRAKADQDTYHAFMHFGSEDEKRRAFDQLIERQRALFNAIREGEC